jgi:hypothetical protein
MRKLLVRVIHAKAEDWYFNLLNKKIEAIWMSDTLGAESFILWIDRYNPLPPLIPRFHCELIGEIAAEIESAPNPIRPEHYGGESNPFEAVKIIDHYNLSFYPGNVIKYLLRAGKKDPSKTIEDLKKAAWYLNRYIEVLEKKK